MSLRIDLNLLRLLVAVYDAGSVTLAAQRLKMSQPAASAALTRLRESFGDQLFIRTPSGMEPTARTEAIIASTREILERIDHQILANPRHDPASFSGEFVLCMSALGEVIFLPQLLPLLRRASPRATVRSITLPAHQVHEALQSGQVDLAMGYYPGLGNGDIFQSRLFSHDLVCLVRHGHPLKGPRLTMDEFVQCDQAFVSDGSRTQEMLDELLAERKIQRNIVLYTGHYLSIPPIICKSDLLVVTPRWLTDHFAKEGIRPLELPFDLPNYTLRQFWHRKFHTEPKTVWLRSLVSEHFAAMPNTFNKEQSAAPLV
jgi:DNA-binding transcriptional LysR family regulator